MDRLKPLLDRFVEDAESTFRDDLVGVYLHGSAAMGCYNPAKSDLDLIVVVQDTPSDAVKHAYMEKLVRFNTELSEGRRDRHAGIEMSVVRRSVCDPFLYPTPFELHFSAGHIGWWERDPEDYIRKMNGTDKDLAAHFTVIRARGRCLYGAPIEAVFGAVPENDYFDSIREDICGAREEIRNDPMYLTLNLARVLAFKTQGLVLSKKEGGQWALRNLPEKYRSLIADALRDYETEEKPQYDFDLAEVYAQDLLDRIKG